MPSPETTVVGSPAYRDGHRYGEAAERARIIAWLREQAEQHRLSGCVSAPEWRDALLWAARDIEQGREVRKATHE